jgi:hypothetical protein
VLRAEQLALGLEPGDFWGGSSVEALARERGVQPVSDARVLRDAKATPDEVDRLLAALRDH